MALLDHTSIRRQGLAAIAAASSRRSRWPVRGLVGTRYRRRGRSPPANTFHAFLLDDGEFTTIDPPGASGALTVAIGINDHRQIVGYYVDACGTLHGFLRDRKGVFTTIDHPDFPLGTAALDINNRGQIVGTYAGAEPTAHGFLLDKGVFTTIDFPGASFTEALGINGRGQIVGFTRRRRNHPWFPAGQGPWCSAGRGRLHHHRTPGRPGDSADDINNRGQIVGSYSEVSNTRPLDAPRAYLLDGGALP